MENNCEETDDIVNKILSDRKNSNLILKLEDSLLSTSEESTLVGIKNVKKLFSHFIQIAEMVIETQLMAGKKDAETEYKDWLSKRYTVVKQCLLGHLTSEIFKISRAALITLLTFLEAEIKHPLSQPAKDTWHFPKDFLELIVKALVSDDCNLIPLLKTIRSHLNDVVKLYTLKCLCSIIQSNIEKSEMFYMSMFTLMKLATFPKSFDAVNSEEPTGTENSGFVLKKKPFAKAFSQVWIEFLKHELPRSLNKQVVSYLPLRVLPFLNDPLKLTDFLTESYSYSGIISLLALKGIYYLIQHHNLEYRDFFPKLYSLFTVEVLMSKYRVRFFYLADLFLSSTHLPSCMVASFAKRLSRLALSVSPDIVLIILPFIRNLIIRHPTLQILIDSTSTEELNQDPFMFEELDPSKTEAMSSSLWEVKTFQNHWHPDVAKAAKFINTKPTEMEKDISSISHLTMQDLIQKELDKEIKEVHLSYDKPEGFFLRKEDTMNDLWT